MVSRTGTKLLADANVLLEAATAARVDGNNEAFVALVTAAAQRVHLAGLFERIDKGLGLPDG